MAEQKKNKTDSFFNANQHRNTSPLYQLNSQEIGIVSISRQQFNGSQIKRCIDSVIIEEPLQIRLIHQDAFGQEQDRIFLVTMRTPGDDLNLVTGLLLAEGVINNASDIIAINEHLDADEISANDIHVHLAADIVIDWTLIKRDSTSFSSCGVCGKSSMKSLELRNIAPLDETAHWLPAFIIPLLGDKLYKSQAMFSKTGGVHGCALFDSTGELLLSCEDVGRHNALDKLMGKLARSTTLQQQQKIVFLSGRISFELVQKILVAGISVLVAVGAPSNLAINMAKRFNLTLIGFSREGCFNIYHGTFRLNFTVSELISLD